MDKVDELLMTETMNLSSSPDNFGAIDSASSFSPTSFTSSLEQESPSPPSPVVFVVHSRKPKEHLTLAGHSTPPPSTRSTNSSGRLRHHDPLGALATKTVASSPFVPRWMSPHSPMPPSTAKSSISPTIALTNQISSVRSKSSPAAGNNNAAISKLARSEGADSAATRESSPMAIGNRSSPAGSSSDQATGFSGMQVGVSPPIAIVRKPKSLTSSSATALGPAKSLPGSAPLNSTRTTAPTAFLPPPRQRAGSTGVHLRHGETMRRSSSNSVHSSSSIGLVDNDHAPAHHLDLDVQRLVHQAADGLRAGYAPTLADEGTGGAYFLYSAHGNPCAVFKPSDEEPSQPNNPRAYLERFAQQYQKSGAGAAGGGGGGRHGQLLPPASPLLLRERARTWTASSMLTDASAIADAAAARSSIPGGQAACREVIAYMLDREHHAGVPATALVSAEHQAFFDLAEEERLACSPASQWATLTTSKQKIGSCQQFVRSQSDCEDLPMSVLRQFARHQVHKIAVLDLALFNTDRHGGNILVVPSAATTSASGAAGEGTALGVDAFSGASSDASIHAAKSSTESYDNDYYLDNNSDGDDDSEEDLSAGVFRAGEQQEPPSPLPLSWSDDHCSPSRCLLVPIDHGYTLPENLSEAWFEWMTWPQAAEPFDQSTRDYIAHSLSWSADAAILHKFQAAVSRDARTVHRIAVLWLQAGAAANMTPRAIAAVACRSQLDKHSRLERMVARAKQHAAEAIGQLDVQQYRIDPDEAEKRSVFWRVLAKLMRREAERIAAKKQPVKLVMFDDEDEDEDDDVAVDFDEEDAADQTVVGGQQSASQRRSSPFNVKSQQNRSSTKQPDDDDDDDDDDGDNNDDGLFQLET